MALQFRKGLVYMIVASLVFAFMGAAVKWIGEGLSPIQVVFYRNVLGTAFILFSLLGKKLENKGGNFWLLVFRGVTGTLSLYALFYNITYLDLGIAITYLQTAPIFVAIFSWFFLKEYLSVSGWIAILIGFVGIFMIFKPDVESNLTANIIGIFNGIGAGAAYTSVRALRKYYDNRTIVLAFMLVGLILPAFSFALGEWGYFTDMPLLSSEFALPDTFEWFPVLIVGITALTGQILITIAYRYEKAGLVSAIGYINIPFAIVVGILMGDPFPDEWSMLGIMLIISSGVLISFSRNPK